jgi:4a-hydroxytetrahydrobiopterin dehydratase
MAIEKLTGQQINEALAGLPGWTLQDEKLHRALKFKNFVQAWGFMSQVALLAERADHHPEWSNVYSRVTIDLTTHEAGGISRRDLELARQINQMLAGLDVA